MAKRKSTGKRQRFEIFKRDGFRCAYCGRTPPDVLLVVDHVVPVAAGGSNEPINLITACEPCNQGKSDRPLTEVAAPLADQAAAAARRAELDAEMAEQVRAYMEASAAKRGAESDTIALIEKRWFDSFNPYPERWTYSFRPDERSSIAMFLRKLPAPVVLEAVDIAAAASYRTPSLHVVATEQGQLTNAGRVFRYFCGVCWNAIREREGE